MADSYIKKLIENCGPCPYNCDVDAYESDGFRADIHIPLLKKHYGMNDIKAERTYFADTAGYDYYQIIFGYKREHEIMDVSNKIKELDNKRTELINKRTELINKLK